jgi:hypothetical protein
MATLVNAVHYIHVICDRHAPEQSRVYLPSVPRHKRTAHSPNAPAAKACHSLTPYTILESTVAVLDCMPVAHFRISASLAYRAGTALLPLPIHSTHRPVLPRLFHLASGRSPHISTRTTTLQTRPHFGSKPIPPLIPPIPALTIMFKQAVRNHSTTTPAPIPPAASKQQSLTSSFTRPQTTPNSRVNNTTGTRPLSTLSTNASRTNTEVPSRTMSGQNHGIKRTSSGLAKALSSQEDSFDYSSINISDWEIDTPPVRSAQNNTQTQDPVFSNSRC